MTSKRPPAPVHTSADKASGQRGLALLVVLWIVASATLLVLAFGVVARSGASLASSEIEMTATEALLDAGAEIAATRLIDERQELRWRADGSPHDAPFAASHLRITIDDPNGFIDLNKADSALLLGLFRQFAPSEQAARDLRDRVLEARGESPNKFDSSIPAAKSPKSAKDTSRPTAFIDVAQLRYVEGMTLELYRQLVPYLTVCSRDGLINPLSASDTVLSSLPDMTLADVERVKAYVRARAEDQATVPPVMEKVSHLLTDATGPAYLVSVAASIRGASYRAAKAYVLMPDFDNHAPYRLVSKRPLALTE